MRMSVELPEKWRYQKLPRQLIRTGAGVCAYQECMLIFGGSRAWIKEEEYSLFPPDITLFNPKTNKTTTITIQGDIEATMNPAMFYDFQENRLYILAAEHTNKLKPGQVGWCIDMTDRSSVPWEGPREARFFTSEAFGYDPEKRIFYTFHLTGSSAADSKNVFYKYSLFEKKWTKIPIPTEVCTRYGSGGLFIPQKQVFVIYSGYYWDDKEKPYTLHDLCFYYPDSGEWRHVPCGEQIGSSSSRLLYDPLNDRIIIIQGSPNGVSAAHQGWMYLFEQGSPRGHCSGEIKLLFNLPVVLGICPQTFIAENKLYILSGTSNNQNLEYGLILELKDNLGLDVLG